MDDQALLEQLEPNAATLVDRHLGASKEWFPHAVVPWDRGPEVEPDRPWSPDDTQLPPAVRSSLLVNLLTEDNLPYYFRDIHRMFGSGDDAWGFWTRRWTAEEGRHSIAIRDYLTLTRAICPVELERARMAQVQCGEVPYPPSSFDGFAYLTLQELATRIAHHNTGKVLDDDLGYQVMKRVAADENFHFLFYRDISAAAFEVAPSEMMVAVDRQVRDFEMPGVGIADFTAHAKAIAKAGIYDFAIHYESILVPVVLRHWKIEDLSGLTEQAEQARDRTLTYMARLRRVVERQRERSASAAVAG